jgi:hypothetical protein
MRRCCRDVLHPPARARERYEPDIQAYVDQVFGVHISALPIAA